MIINYEAPHDVILHRSVTTCPLSSHSVQGSQLNFVLRCSNLQTDTSKSLSERVLAVICSYATPDGCIRTWQVVRAQRWGSL